MASILIVSGPNEGNYYPLGKRTIVVGRDEACPVQVTDERVSRRHLQLRFDEERKQYIAFDMKSANGTLVNGRELLGEIGLVDNDEIMIGASKIMFSEREFANKESAWANFKERGHKRQSTIQQRG